MLSSGGGIGQVDTVLRATGSTGALWCCGGAATARTDILEDAQAGKTLTAPLPLVTVPRRGKFPFTELR